MLASSSVTYSIPFISAFPTSVNVPKIIYSFVSLQCKYI